MASHAWELRVGGSSPWQLSRPNLQNLPGFFLPYIWGSRLAGSLPLESVVGATNTNDLKLKIQGIKSSSSMAKDELEKTLDKDHDSSRLKQQIIDDDEDAKIELSRAFGDVFK